MNLNNLKYFVDSARFQSMTKSADINHLSRPAISHAIQKLESELGTKLLAHGRRKFELTPAGAYLLRRSEALFAHVDELEGDLRSNRAPLHGEFRIGSSRTLATFNLPLAMTRLREKFPKVDFKVSLANSDALVQKLLNREIDLAFLIGDDAVNDFKDVVINRGSFCLIQPKNCDQSQIQYAITERRPETERLRNLYQRQFHKPLPVFVEVQSWDAIYTWVNQDLCGGLVPDFMLSTKAKSVRKFNVVIPKVFPYEIKAIYSKAKVNHPVIAEFLAFMSKN